MKETERGLRATIEYNTDLFEAETIERMMGHFENMLEAVVADPEQRVSELEMLTASRAGAVVGRVERDVDGISSGSSACTSCSKRRWSEAPEAVALVLRSRASELWGVERAGESGGALPAADREWDRKCWWG